MSRFPFNSSISFCWFVWCCCTRNVFTFRSVVESVHFRPIFASDQTKSIDSIRLNWSSQRKQYKVLFMAWNMRIGVKFSRCDNAHWCSAIGIKWSKTMESTSCSISNWFTSALNNRATAMKQSVCKSIVFFLYFRFSFDSR